MSTRASTVTDVTDSSTNVPGSQPSGTRILLGYGAMLTGGIIAYEVIRRIGLSLAVQAQQLAANSSVVPISQSGASGHQAAPNVLLHVLLALAAIVLCSRAAGAFCRLIHQPPVIGEVLAGILLGPSLLGQVAPGVMAAIFPPLVVAPLGIIAQIGVVLFMFLVGLELNTDTLRERSRSALAISHASIVFPFILGAALSLYLYPRVSSPDVPFTGFSLFLAVSMSVTAFPVLARILTDRGLQKSRLGNLALTCAAINDVTAWCLLAFVVGVVHSRLGGAALTAILIIILTIAYIGFMFLLARPFLQKPVNRYEAAGDSGQPLTAIVLICLLISCLLLSCLAAEAIGIHAIFGAFTLGALIRHDSRIAVELHDKLNDFVVVMLLPAFFALTGLRTQIGLIAGSQWLTCGIIILVAFAANLAARLSRRVLPASPGGIHMRSAS